MRFFKKSISLFLSFAMVFSFVSFSAHAVDYSSKSDMSFWDYYCRVGLSLSKPLGLFGDLTGYTYAQLADGLCAVSSDGYHHASQSIEYGVDGGVAVCDFCGDRFTFNSKDLEASYSSYVSTLGRTTASSDNSIVSFHPFYSMLGNGISAGHNVSYGYFTRSIDFQGSYGRTDLMLYHKDYNGNTVGLVSSPLSLPEGEYIIPSITVTARYPYFGTLGTSCFYLSVYRYEESTGTLTELASFKRRPGSSFLDSFEFTTSDLAFYATSDYVYFVRLSFSGYVPLLDQTSGYTLSAPVQLLLNGESAVETLPTSTRTASLMQTINNYNIDNSYTDNSTTVNYFIGSLADDGSVSDIYAPNLFDEDTMIFTEPETGTEYQAAGWLYNYETRTYGIAFDSGVLTVNDTGVDYVRLTYGDNAVTVEYFQGDAETLVSSSSYAYVMASQSACNINGHTYTYETVKEPTCTAPGERKYTCSVCGDEYAEEIPTVGHSYEYSIYQAPTCTAAGIGLYTCSTCGDQYTEPIAATGHTSELIEYVPTVYDDNGIVVSAGYSVYRCSVCGAEYTVADEIPMESEGWFDGFANAIKSFGKAAFSAIGSGLSKVFSGFTDLIGGIFGFLSDTVLGGVKNFFSSFSDSSILDIFQQENEDGSTTTTLPEGMSGAMATVGGFITGLPSELLGVLVFGIALLLLLAALKLLL